MAKTGEIIEAAAPAGALVTGGKIAKIRSYFEQGIRPGLALENVVTESSPNICFALLAEIALPRRYDGAFHFGPNSVFGGDNRNFGVIVSREALMQKFPGQLRAMGDRFHNRSDRAIYGESYQYDKKQKTVFGIPIRQPTGHRWYQDEVRLSPDDPLTAAVTPDVWSAITISREVIHEVVERLRGLSSPPDIPVLSDHCRLIAPSLSKMLKRFR